MSPIGRDFIKALIKCATGEPRLQFGESIIIKKLDTANPGDPTKGISPSYTFIKTRSRGVITQLSQSDILNTGGLYQVGDLTVSLNEDLEEVSDTTRGIGDRLVWRGNEYRLVGKKKNYNVVDRDHFFMYVMRKVD